jgi:hypothetical protein
VSKKNMSDPTQEDKALSAFIEACVSISRAGQAHQAAAEALIDYLNGVGDPDPDEPIVAPAPDLTDLVPPPEPEDAPVGVAEVSIPSYQSKDTEDEERRLVCGGREFLDWTISSDVQMVWDDFETARLCKVAVGADRLAVLVEACPGCEGTGKGLLAATAGVEFEGGTCSLCGGSGEKR